MLGRSRVKPPLREAVTAVRSTLSAPQKRQTRLMMPPPASLAAERRCAEEHVAWLEIKPGQSGKTRLIYESRA